MPTTRDQHPRASGASSTSEPPTSSPPGAQTPVHRTLAYRGDERHPTVQRFSEVRCPDLDCVFDIAAGDEMFQYALAEQHQHRGLALLAYLRSGLTAAETLGAILRWRFGSLEDVASLFDFASGYGRVTRFLAPRLPSRLVVGEISGAAMDFQRSTFGVDTVRSHTSPAQLELRRSFAALSALSLFTHLPERNFTTWLRRLWEAVDPGGLLVFSTNGDQVLMGDAELDDRGFCFRPVSENHDLELAEYGTTWVSPTFVRQCVETHCDDVCRIEHLPRGLWHFQDLWVVVRADPQSDLGSSLPSLDVALPAEGYLDICIQKGPHRVDLGGWAIDRQSPSTPPRLRVELTGHEPIEVNADEPRDELARALGPQFERCGWRVGIEAERFAPESQLWVTATTVRGRTTVLHSSALEGADLVRRAAGGLEETRAANLHLRAQTVHLEQRIAWMEASRFWKVRNAWFRLRGRTD